MLELLMGTALLYFPIALPCGMLCFLIVRRSLQGKHRFVRFIVRAGLFLCLTILIAGIIYGALRFSGTILFTDDNTVSYNWFGASWRDDGFKYIYTCGIAFIGIVTAFLFEKRSWKPANTTLES